MTGSPERAAEAAPQAPNLPGAMPARVAATRGEGKIRKSARSARFTWRGGEPKSRPSPSMPRKTRPRPAGSTIGVISESVSSMLETAAS